MALCLVFSFVSWGRVTVSFGVTIVTDLYLVSQMTIENPAFSRILF